MGTTTSDDRTNRRLSLAIASIVFGLIPPCGPCSLQAQVPEPDPAKLELRRPAGDAKSPRSKATPEEELEGQIADLYEQVEARKKTRKSNASIVADVDAGFRDEFRANHLALTELRDAKESGEPFRTLVVRQKILAMYLVELGNRLQTPNPRDLVHQVLQKARALRRHAAARKPEFQKKIGELEQKINTEVRQSPTRRFQRMTVDEITRSILGEDAAYETESNKYVHPTAQEGTLQEYRDPMRRLLRIQWTGKQLAIDREHWDSPFAGKSESAVVDEVSTLLASRGYEEISAKNGHVVGFRSGNQQVRSNVQRLFQNFQKSARGGTHSHSVTNMRSETAKIGVALDTGSPFRFEISERDGSNRLLKIRQSGRALTIQFLGEILLDFQQSENGTVRIREIDNEDVFQMSADSFADLYRENPEYCELRLFPLLDHIGIVAPFSRFDEPVLSFVEKTAMTMLRSGQLDFDSLLSSLGHRDYAKREVAMAALRDDIDFYAARLLDTMENSQMPTEMRMRVQTLVRHASRKRRSIENEAALIVQSHRLLDDPEYLRVVVSRCRESATDAIAARITQLEKQDRSGTE